MKKACFVKTTLFSMALCMAVFSVMACGKQPVDSLIDELDKSLTELIELVAKNDGSLPDPATMARMTKLGQRIEKLQAKLERIDESSLTEEQMTKLYSLFQKIMAIQ